MVEPTSVNIHVAEMVCIKFIQQSLGNYWKIRLGPMEIDGLISVGKRITAWQKNNWNQNSFICVPSNYAFAKLDIKHILNIDHAGMEVTLTKIQAKFLVSSASRAIKFAKDRCVTQKMELENSRLEYRTITIGKIKAITTFLPQSFGSVWTFSRQGYC